MLLLLVGTSDAAAQDVAAATVRGTVVDGRTGVALPRVLVSVEGGPSAETTLAGAFSLTGLNPGDVRLFVSAVGYGLVQRTVRLRPGAILDLTIPLVEGTATYAESVDVTADRFFRPQAGVPAQHVLRSADLQNLRGVVADDALRAVQVLPGVATGDDFRSEFSVRGSPFAHLNFTIDGFATPFLMHMVRAVDDRANTGSVAMVNADVLEEVVLSSGGYAQRVGNRTGAELSFAMREGSRDRRIVRTSVSGTSASATAEGPLGTSKGGSWLISGRKSYLDLLIDRLSDEGLSFGFADAQAKLRYDLTPRQSASLTLLAGDSRLRELPEGAAGDDRFVGNNASAIAIGTWRRLLARGLLSAGIMGAANAFNNYEVEGTNLEEGTDRQLVLRSDLLVGLGRGVQLESGILVDRTREFGRRRREAAGGAVVTLNDYRATGTRAGGYLRVDVPVAATVTLSPGMRIDRWDLTGETTASPWLQAEVARIGRLPGLTIRAGTGLYQQFPDFEKVRGAFAAADPRAERSIHADVSVERRFSPAVRLQVTLYTREDREQIRRPGAESRLVDGVLVRGSPSARYANRADGFARGVETVLHRSSPSGLSGWISYAFGRNRYEDRGSGETYWGDLDQRHTLNAYGFYRFSHRFSASVKLRTGSNFPIPGYYRQEGPRYFVAAARNTARLPSYARLDLRGNRTFVLSQRRLTLFVEVMNVLNRENVRFNPPRISTATGEVTRLFDSLVPVVPSAGLLFEF